MINISHMTLFTTALCNLDCSYCYICKDTAGGLKQIDNDLKNDFKNCTQIKQVLDYDKNIANSLTGITLWGGEPFLHIDRFTDTIGEYFKTFQNLKSIDTSTNFTIPNQVKALEKLLNAIDENYHGTEPFLFDLQISIDGYEEMNDAGRGHGVTQKFLNNFYDLLNLKYNSKKIYLTCHTKPTLAENTFKFLETDEGILKWFQFFDEKMIRPFLSSNTAMTFTASLWNCAQPTEWSSEDGKRYAKISKSIARLTPQIKKLYPGWASRPTLVPEAQLIADILLTKDIDQIAEEFRTPCRGGGCGAFVHNIVPIPHNSFTMCHRGLFDAYVEYSNNFKSKENMNNLSKEFFQAQNSEDWIYTKDDLKKMQKTMQGLDCNSNQIRYTDLVTSIKEYAAAGIIDEKYKSISAIESTLGYFLLNSYCLQDSYIFTGSWTTMSTLEVPLFYNGTMEVVEEEIERIRLEKGWRIT